MFRKLKKRNQKTQQEKDFEYVKRYLEHCGIAACFRVEPPRKFCKKHSEEEIMQERRKMLEECKRMLREYEERTEKEEQKCK